ncbi:prepilin-type N-terminal cleavage/methylation domain-containing protein [Clostridiaceae bacterium DONG20-135]|uniref:Prepilin-type N-terminal cleavage/methylation domain-containing protein n=1 Tax=Copranaerobaculum intestinale TaxID=2692629 RepID=A0A6N8UEG5_9FIRM|nr:prepilin-type N-terminal cleavage/methylation domain-containing protein [Copranaerobaculum intestinale]MXQ73767.1 prepilin-type N-terminal cleavage/methylation domain-containing protein [Copranaerobaculum intestinale]
MLNKDGFTLIEMIIALSICAFLTPLVFSVLNAMLHVPKQEYATSDRIMIHQLRRIFAEGSEAAIEDQTLVLLYRDKESVLQIDQNRLVKRPGYEIFSSNLQSAQFYKEDTCIYLRWKHTHEKTTKQALLGC